MKEDYPFIVPCCIQNELPKALSNAPHHALLFNTHGDVTAEKFYRAVSYLVSEPHVLVLSMPSVNVEMVAFLQQCFDRGWITDLVLTLGVECEALIERIKGSYSSHVLYAVDGDISLHNSHMHLYSHKQALSIQGPMSCKCIDANIAQYAAVLHNVSDFKSVEYGNPLYSALLPDVVRIRRQVKLTPHSISRNLERFYAAQFPPYKDED